MCANPFKCELNIVKQTNISAGLIKPWWSAMFILHHSYQTEVSRGSKRLITCDEKIIEHSKNDRYRCVRRGIGIDTMRGVSRELRSWNSSATLLAHPSTPSTPLSSFYRRRPSPGIYLFPRGSYAARCLVCRLSGTSEQRNETGEGGALEGWKSDAGSARGRESARGETPRVVTR